MSVKMDTARALGLMGFTSTRWMDASTGQDPKVALDKALFDQTQNLSMRRTSKSQKEGGRGRGKPKVAEVPTKSSKSAEEKYADDIRNLHEAYQFLMKKYNLAPRSKKQSSEEDFGISAVEMSQQGDFFSSIRAEENDVIAAPVEIQED